MRLLPHGEWHASGDHERRGHDARPFHGSRWLVLGRFFVMAGRMFMVLRRFCMMFCALLAHMAFDAFSFFLRVEVQIGSRSIRIRLQYADGLLGIKDYVRGQTGQQLLTSTLAPVNCSGLAKAGVPTNPA